MRHEREGDWVIDYLMIRDNWEFALWIGFGWMVGVPLLLALYYHFRVRRVAGGQALRQAQRDLRPSGGDMGGDLASASEMWRRLRSNQFHPDARRLVWQCIIGSIVWIVVAAGWFGVLLYVDAKMQARGGWPEVDNETRYLTQSGAHTPRKRRF